MHVLKMVRAQVWRRREVVPNLRRFLPKQSCIKSFSSHKIDPQDYEYLQTIKMKELTNIKSDSHSNHSDKIFAKVLDLKKRTKYEFDTLNKIATQFLKHPRRRENYNVIRNFFDLMGYNYYFTSDIKDFIIEIIQNPEENTIYLYYIIAYYINQINYSRAILLELPYSFFQNWEKTFYDKGFLLNLRDLSYITNLSIKYDKFLTQTFFAYLEQCVLNNLENKMLQGQSIKDHLNSIIVKLIPIASINFIKKLFATIQARVGANEYLSDDLFEMLISCCKIGMSFIDSPENEVKYKMFVENITKMFKHFVESVNNSTSFNYIHFRNFFLLGLDFSDLFYNADTGKYLIDQLFLAKFLEKSSDVTVEDLSDLLFRYCKRKYCDIMIYNQLEPLINSHLHNFSQIKHINSLAHFLMSYDVSNSRLYQYIEIRFVLLMLSDNKPLISEVKHFVPKAFSLINKNKVHSNFFFAVLQETVKEMERLTGENGANNQRAPRNESKSAEIREQEENNEIKSDVDTKEASVKDEKETLEAVSEAKEEEAAIPPALQGENNKV